jgi:hypothetical protein
MLGYLGMAQDADILLFERAKIAALEARRLIEINLAWQCRAHAIVRQMTERRARAARRLGG